MSPPPPTADSPPDSSHNLTEYSVSEISGAVKRTLEGTFGRVRVRGEISRPNYHGSGHLYLTLKDENAVLDGVCWRGTVQRLSLRIEEGMEVICTGRISSYPRSSKYQLVIDSVELAGEGALLKMLEARRKALAAEGLFDDAHKRALPFLPSVIGVVTSPTGAVIRDILHRLSDRFPRHVLLWPVRVQGESAAAEIVRAIEGFNALAPGGAVPRPDVLIVARGGGSLEDLMPFNEESVVRAAAGSDIPLISAVGHETDTTLIDYAADRRAPTPTAAAEMAVPVRAELLAQILDDGARLQGAAARMLTDRAMRLEGLGRGLPDPRTLFEQAMQRLDSESERLKNGIGRYVEQRAGRVQQAGASLRHPREQISVAAAKLANLPDRLRDGVRRRLRDDTARLAAEAKMLESLSYRNVLKRGYAVVRGDAGMPIADAASISAGDALSIELRDGRIDAVAAPDGGSEKPSAKPQTAKPQAKKKAKDERQGRLI